MADIAFPTAKVVFRAAAIAQDSDDSGGIPQEILLDGIRVTLIPALKYVEVAAPPGGVNPTTYSLRTWNLITTNDGKLINVDDPEEEVLIVASDAFPGYVVSWKSVIEDPSETLPPIVKRWLAPAGSIVDLTTVTSVPNNPNPIADYLQAVYDAREARDNAISYSEAASSSAREAQTAKNDAVVAKNDAETARDDALQAKAQVVAAQEAASGSAVAAATSAGSAADSAQRATQAKNDAQTAQGAAATSAGSAADSAQRATQAKNDAQTAVQTVEQTGSGILSEMSGLRDTMVVGGEVAGDVLRLRRADGSTVDAGDVRGQAATLELSAQTGEPGTEVVVDNLGTPQAANYRLTIPQGAPGEAPILLGKYVHSGNLVAQPTAVDLETGIFTCVGHGLTTGNLVRPRFNTIRNTPLLAVFPGGLTVTDLTVTVLTPDTFTVGISSFTSVDTMDLSAWAFERYVTARNTFHRVSLAAPVTSFRIVSYGIDGPRYIKSNGFNASSWIPGGVITDKFGSVSLGGEVVFFLEYSARYVGNMILLNGRKLVIGVGSVTTNTITSNIPMSNTVLSTNQTNQGFDWFGFDNGRVYNGNTIEVWDR